MKVMQTPQEPETLLVHVVIWTRTTQLICSNFSFNRRKSSLFGFALEDFSLILLGKKNTLLP